MTTKKQMTALLLAGVMALGLLTGCQSGGGASSAPPAASSPAASSPAASSGAVSTVPEVDLEAITDICQYTADIPGGTVVATVDGADITAAELLYWVALYCDDIVDHYGLTEIPWEAEFDGKSMAQFILDNALSGAAAYHLVEQKAAAENLSVSQENLDVIAASVKSIEEDVEKQGLDMQTYLWQFILTSDLYAWYCECEYLIEEMANARYGMASFNYPTDEVVIDYLEQTYGVYSTKHILKATLDTATREPLDADAVAQKKAQAEDILRQLRASDDPLTLFDQLMKEHSEDPGLQGYPDGYLAVGPGEFDPAYEQAALALEEGQISDVVEGASGFHIILRIPLGIDPAQYRDAYVSAKMMEERNTWLEQAQIQTTDWIQKIDPERFYQALGAYRDAVTASTATTENG